jgi:hypothetical protein
MFHNASITVNGRAHEGLASSHCEVSAALEKMIDVWPCGERRTVRKHQQMGRG